MKVKQNTDADETVQLHINQKKQIAYAQFSSCSFSLVMISVMSVILWMELQPTQG